MAGFIAKDLSLGARCIRALHRGRMDDSWRTMFYVAGLVLLDSIENPDLCVYCDTDWPHICLPCLRSSGAYEKSNRLDVTRPCTVHANNFTPPAEIFSHIRAKSYAGLWRLVWICIATLKCHFKGTLLLYVSERKGNGAPSTFRTNRTKFQTNSKEIASKLFPKVSTILKF